MMKDGTTVEQRDIVLISLPYTDLTKTKNRPAVILSNESFNDRNEDIICCAITSNPRNYNNSIELTKEDLDYGYLKYVSRIKPDKVFTLEQNKIIKKLGRLNVSKSKKIVKNLNKSIKVKE